MEQSSKLKFLMILLKKLKEEKHRILIFSQSTKVLDLIEALLDENNYTYLRIDGSVTKMTERQSRIDEFNTNRQYFCFLLTTQVGGVGLNLVGANRVVIFDPSWNNMDDQVVDRAYRIGQTKNVIIYRLITCGTIEEKMYRKQVFKGSLSRCMTQKDQSHHRYFTSTELSELFRLDDPKSSQTQLMLKDLHSNKRKHRESLDAHSQWLSSLNIFGISDHDLLFSEEVEKVKKSGQNDLVEQQVQAATHKLQRSSSISIFDFQIDESSLEEKHTKKRKNMSFSEKSIVINSPFIERKSKKKRKVEEKKSKTQKSRNNSNHSDEMDSTFEFSPNDSELSDSIDDSDSSVEEAYEIESITDSDDTYEEKNTKNKKTLKK